MSTCSDCPLLPSLGDQILIKGILHNRQNLLFRAHHSKSLSPLVLPGGFTATTDEYKRSSPLISRATWQTLNEDFLGAYVHKLHQIRASIRLHIDGGYFDDPTPGRDLSSPWISTTTKSFIWDLHYICRDLLRGNVSQVGLSVIHRRGDLTLGSSERYTGEGQIVVDAEKALSGYKWRETKEYIFAKSSREVLFRGRIFDEDILETTS